MTVTAPGSWQAPPLPRQQHLLPRRTRFSRGTYLVKCAPGLSCIETFSSSCTRKGLPRKQLANSLSRRADGSINKAQASSSSPSPIPPCLPPPFHLPKARSRRAEQQQQVQKVRGRRERRGLAAANLLRRGGGRGRSGAARGGGAQGSTCLCKDSNDICATPTVCRLLPSQGGSEFSMGSRANSGMPLPLC